MTKKNLIVKFPKFKIKMMKIYCNKLKNWRQLKSFNYFQKYEILGGRKSTKGMIIN